MIVKVVEYDRGGIFGTGIVEQEREQFAYFGLA